MKQAELRNFQLELTEKIQGEVLFDNVSRYLYSTDASLYQIDPVGVVLPRHRDDLLQAIRTAAKYGVSILPRGGGTSLAGQAVGHSLVIDCTKYMNGLIELNEHEQWVRVEPGIVRDELNAQISASGLHFTPDVATSSRAAVGGMIANNSAGTHSILYGRTVDEVIELKAILADGKEVMFTALDDNARREKEQQPDLEGQIYREVRRIIKENEEEIRRRYPRVMRRAGGYNLDLILDDPGFNLARLVTGSEGTLAFISEAKLRVRPLPQATGVLIAHFSEVSDALRAVAPIVGHGPSAIELLDRTVLELAAKNLRTARLESFIQGKPAAILIVEFFGSNNQEVEAKIAKLEQELGKEHRAYVCSRALDEAGKADVWYVRKAGLGILLGMKGDYKPLPFIEDAAVPVEKLPDYIREVHEVVKTHDREAVMYAHASVGLIHVRPVLNLKQAEDMKIMQSISERVLELVLKYGGMMSGEHGDGLVRSWLNRRFFGDQLYQAFVEVKRAFDPNGLYNPGKIVANQGITENLRIDANYQPSEPYTHFHFDEDGGFARAVEMCTGVGACRKIGNGTMCPSYMATRDEEHSTRGRANALRAALTGRISTGNFTNKRLYEVFDLCLACKACKAECPSNVDVAKLKYEFLSKYYDEHGTPLSLQLFARPDLLGRFAGKVAGLANRTLQSQLTRTLIEKTLGIDRRRVLPLYAKQSFSQWFNNRSAANGAGAQSPSVVLFNDTFMNYYEPEIGIAAVRVLEGLGYHVILADAGCCGRAQISNGLLRSAKPQAEALVAKLAEYVDRGLTMVGCEPSCVTAIKEDYPDFVRNTETAKKVAAHFMQIDDFVFQSWQDHPRPDSFKQLGREILYHGHCHQKSLYGTTASKSALTQLADCSVREVDSGCCGMAGAFGYEKRHYDISLKIGGQRLFPAIEGTPPEHRIVANGFSCRHQIEHATGRRAKHMIEILAEAVNAGQ